jgi:hypothetical protein
MLKPKHNGLQIGKIRFKPHHKKPPNIFYNNNMRKMKEKKINTLSLVLRG